MTVDLDTRMRAARDSLLGAADHVSPRRPTRPPRSLRPAAVVAVAVAMVLVVVGVAVRPDHQDGLKTVVSPPSAVPRLVPGYVPQGVPDLEAIDLPLQTNGIAQSGLSFGTGSLTLYGDPRAEDPFARADLAVAVTAHDPVPQIGDGDKVTVRGRTGMVIDVGGPVTFIAWQERPGRFVVAGSHTLDRQQLLAAADALVMQGDRATLGPEAPRPAGHLDLMAEIPGFPLDGLVMGMAPLVRTSAKGYLLDNETDESERAVVVITATGGAPDVAVIRWITHADTPVRVRGHDGWAGVDPEVSADRAVVWQEAPGVVAVVLSGGMSQRDLLHTAASLHPATDREWHVLRAAAGSGASPQVGGG